MQARPTTLFDILRHGEPVGGPRYRGWIDDPLSDRGWQQMRAATASSRPWDIILSSPMKRCAEFAQELSASMQVPLEYDERFREIGFGEWEGQTSTMITAHDPERIRRFRLDPVTHRPDNAEMLDDFEQRVTGAWREHLQSHCGKHVLLVAHAGVTRLILCHAMHIPVTQMFRIHVPTAGLTRFHIEHLFEQDMVRLQFHGRQRVT
jgi:alpha-ribazole phosphatase/probable phosphoglycerate mutase